MGSSRPNGMMSPRVTDGGDNLQARIEAVNILNRLSRVADSDGPPAWLLCGRIQGTVEDQNFKECYTESMTRLYLVTTVMRSCVLQKAEIFLTKRLSISQGRYFMELVTYSRG